MAFDLLSLVAIGFCAQLVDGALGMAFGLVSTSAMLTLGMPLAQASAAVHTAEVFTTAASGIAHWRAGNVDRKLCLALAVAGAAGGALGAFILSNVDGKAIRPIVSAYLLLMGLLILMRVARLSPLDDAKPAYAPPLGLVGGFLDAIGGGGWGPLVTSTLIGSGQAPRLVIGSVSIAEFFVTVTIATTFIGTLGMLHWNEVGALILGGVAAAPLGSIVVRYVRPRALMTLIGLLVCGLATFELMRSLRAM